MHGNRGCSSCRISTPKTSACAKLNSRAASRAISTLIAWRGATLSTWMDRVLLAGNGDSSARRWLPRLHPRACSARPAKSLMFVRACGSRFFCNDSPACAARSSSASRRMPGRSSGLFASVGSTTFSLPEPISVCRRFPAFTDSSMLWTGSPRTFSHPKRAPSNANRCAARRPGPRASLPFPNRWRRSWQRIAASARCCSPMEPTS